MQTLTIELTTDNSLRAIQGLEQKQIIWILKKPDFWSYTRQGEAINNDDFKQWVEYAEASPTVSLIEAKQRWADQRKKLQNLIR